jgi:hypothetical protein
VGLVVEENRSEIAAAWKRAVEAELGPGEAAIGYAVAPLLREMSLALRGEGSPLRASSDGLSRCAVLVRSTAQPGRVAREFKLLHRSLWEVLRRGGHVLSPDERRAADEWLDEALATSLDRLERVRLRVEILERGPVVVPAAARAVPARAPGTPPPLPAQGAPIPIAIEPRAVPPPLPRRTPPPLPPRARPPDPDPRANGAFHLE